MGQHLWAKFVSAAVYNFTVYKYSVDMSVKRKLNNATRFLNTIWE